MKKTKISSDEAFKIFQGIKDLEQSRRNATIDLGLALEHLRLENAHKYILGEESSFLDLLAQPEILISRNLVYNVAKTYETITNLGSKDFTKIALNRLVSIAEVATIIDIQEWLKKAETLGPQDFKDEINEASGKVTSDNCDHDFEDLLICKVCGRKQHK